MKLAVVGAGIAGVTAAYLLARRHDVTLIEREESIGGHTRTIMVDDPLGRLPVDIGFIVCNPRTYPNFYRLLAEWGVSRRDSDMSFGFSCENTGIGYVGPSLREFIRKPTNLLNPKLLRLIREQRRFNQRAAADLAAGVITNQPLGEYLAHLGVSHFFTEYYLLPIAASVWSSPDGNMLQFPALAFIQFFKNHGLLELNNRPTWQTIVGGSSVYLDAFRRHYSGEIRTGVPVESISRHSDQIEIHFANGSLEIFDAVIMATHADVTLRLLHDPTEQEHKALATWHYHNNVVQLHTDELCMPRDRRLWASWNYHRRSDADPTAPVGITYSMNRLQGLKAAREYFVSLNAKSVINPSKVLYETVFSHPGYSPQSIDAQASLRAMNGERKTYFCGAHMRYGFHEDGVVSAVEVAKHFGVSL